MSLTIAACGGNPAGPSALSAVAGPGSRQPGVGVVRLTDDLGGRQLLPSDNWWNQDISGAPIDPQSDTYIGFIGQTRQAHPDFGPPP